jgi:integrase
MRIVLPAETTKTEAGDAFKKALAGASGRRGRGHAPRVTFGELAERYIERGTVDLAPRWAAHVGSLLEKHVLPALGGRMVATLRPLDLEEYRAARVAAGAAPGTANRETSAALRVLSWSVRNDFIEVSPIPNGRIERLPENPRQTYFTPKEFQALAAAFDNPQAWERDRAKVRKLGPVLQRPGRTAEGGRFLPRRFGGGPRPESKASHEHRMRLRSSMDVFKALLLTGSRLGEIVGLTWQDVDLEAGRLHIFQPKVKRAKVLALSPELRELLESQVRGIGAAPVFTRPSGGPWEPAFLQRAFKMAKKLAGIRPELRIHDLRHSTASWLTIAGTSERMVRDVLGHKDARMTARYSHLEPQHLQEALDVLGRLSGGGKVPQGNPRATLGRKKRPAKRP